MTCMRQVHLCAGVCLHLPFCTAAFWQLAKSSMVRNFYLSTKHSTGSSFPSSSLLPIKIKLFFPEGN
ncbi:hypothetical protein POVWA2_010970 [Plasmodium ovale wallikeri]|uniref:Secreted protein n=1 Tax=Plasmodium ovale wallikeri TaxID=864142 RepID=A0A1A8YKW9_PLAOA|nr:hypothetical protein POVWA1_010800 [Plasmodium ovale wallikeri]SBT32690.1 hypothetical protein POVWA2_010970 [Plasmodium ovale wallikeri]